MIVDSSLKSNLVRGLGLALAFASVSLMTGCGMGTVVQGPAAEVQMPAISGVAHGGRQPISGSTITVWAAGNAGYGSAATKLASTITGAAGTFNFPAGTYACPSPTSSTASQLIYLTAQGGVPTTGASANTAVNLMTALGTCSSVLTNQPIVNIDEVSTVASMFALAQFFNPSTESFGSSAANVSVGFTNAFNTVNNLVNINTGTAIVSTTAAGTGSLTGSSVTITPESSKINTIANILAACVNSSGPTSGTCSTLFSDVNATAATDTLQAAYYMATNPTDTVSGTSNLTTIYNLAVPQSPYQTSLSAAPSDWTIGVSYGSNSQTQTSPSTAYLLNYPTYPAVDASGNVWWINASTGSNAGLAGNSLTEIGPTGVPLAQALVSTTATTAANSIVGGHSIAIDPSGNVWVANFGSGSTSSSNIGGYQTNVLEYAPLTATVTSYNVGAGPATLVSDGNGNIFVADTSSTFTNSHTTGATAGAATISKIAANGTITTPVTGVSLTQYGVLQLDSNNNLWLTSGGTTVAEYLANVGTAYSSSNSATLTDPEPMVIDHNNNAFVANYGGSLSEIGAANAATTLAVTNFTATTPAAELSAIDGAGNVWLTNYASKAGYVTEYTNAGAEVSPATGFAKSTSYWYGAYGIAVDQSGNVWVGNFSAGASGTAQAYYTEIVGAAVPVVAPIAAGLPKTPGGTSTIGTKP